MVRLLPIEAGVEAGEASERHIVEEKCRIGKIKLSRGNATVSNM